MFPSNFQTITVKSSPSSSWTRSEDKQFERGIVIFPEGTSNRWEKIAGEVPCKSPLEVREHYDALVYDVSEIESGRVEVPSYGENSFTPSWVSESQTSQISFGSKTVKGSEQDRKKGIPWTEEEHRLFLVGLHKFGKGDWRSISRNAVVSRTPTQVASHAQKYFLRLNSAKKEKKRSSIHDITTDQSNTAAQLNNVNWTGLPPESLSSTAAQPNNMNWAGPPPESLVHHTPETLVPPKFVADRALVGPFTPHGSFGYRNFEYYR